MENSKTELSVNTEVLEKMAEIAAKAGIPAEAAELYGSNKAKITEEFLQQQAGKPQGKLILKK